MKRSHLFSFLVLTACGGSSGSEVGGYVTDVVAPVPASDSGTDDAAPTDRPDAKTPVAVDSGPTPCQGPVRWWPDHDGDGFGDMLERPVAICGDTRGFVTNGEDCADRDERAHPGQTNPQSTSVVGVSGKAAFDFNCDGVSAPTETGVGYCESNGQMCQRVNRIWQGTVPACGQFGAWIEDCAVALNAQCRIDLRSNVQRCL